MLQLYRRCTDFPESLPAGLRLFVAEEWIRYMVFEDGSIYAELPGGIFVVDAPPVYLRR